MTTPESVAAAMQRVETVMQRRPEAGLHDDAPATARWQGGTRILASHANGTTQLTDMPSEIGGSGDQVTPGWLFRAGVASCAATRIAMGAAAQGISLTHLEVTLCSRSDVRGLLGMSEADGCAVSAGPSDVVMKVRIAANGSSPADLQALVEACCRMAPMGTALREAVPVALQVELLEASITA